MAVSCPEVMYGAYYPYLYGRGAARSFHHAPHFQYDRFNVQSGAGNAGSEAYGGAGGAGGAGAGGAAALSSGSASSGAQSPGSPPHAHHPHHAPRLRAKEEDLSAHGRASADGRVRRRWGGRRACARAVRQRQLRGVHALLGRRCRRCRRALREGALPRQAQGERADGVAQPAGVVLQRGGGGGRGGGRRRLRRRRPLRLRPLAPALHRIRSRGSPARGGVPRGGGGDGASQHGGGGLRRGRAAAGPLAAAPPVQARGLARAAPLAPPRPRRLLALLPACARSGSAGARHVQGPLLVLSRKERSAGSRRGARGRRRGALAAVRRATCRVRCRERGEELLRRRGCGRRAGPAALLRAGRARAALAADGTPPSIGSEVNDGCKERHCIS